MIRTFALSMILALSLATICPLAGCVPPVDQPPQSPVIHGFSVDSETIEVGQPVEFSWSVSDPDGDPLRVAISIDASGRDDYVIDEPLGTTTQQHAYASAGTFTARLHVSDGSHGANARVTIDVIGPIEAQVCLPSVGDIVGNDLYVVAESAGEFDLARTWFVVEDREGELEYKQYSGCRDSRWGSAPGFAGSVSLKGLAPGPYTVTVFAEDVLGNAASAFQEFIFDPEPDLEWFEPLAYSVAAPTIRVRATCTDIDPEDCRIEVTIHPGDGTPWASGATSVDTVLDLSEFGAGEVTLAVNVYDKSGRRIHVSRRIHVESNDRLAETVSVGGPIADASADRILFVEDRESDSSSNWRTLKLYDRATETVSRVPLPEGATVYGLRDVYLTSTGAIFNAWESQPTTRTTLLEWGHGKLTELGEYASDLSVAGDFATWRQSSGIERQSVFLRTFSTATILRLPLDTHGYPGNVTPDGVVALQAGDWPQRKIYLFDDGNLVQIANGGAHDVPLTDGVHTIYSRTEDSRRALLMHDGRGEEVVVTNMPEGPNFLGSYYQINAGWVAFLRSGNLGQRHLWRRTPDGRLEQLTFFRESARIERLAPNGEITYVLNSRRYLADASGGLTDIGLSTGPQSYWIDGAWHVAIGRTLFRVVR